MTIQLADSSRPEETVKKKFSKTDSLLTIQKTMKEVFSIPEGVPTRLWIKYSGKAKELLTNLEMTTVHDASLFHDQVMIIERQKSDDKIEGIKSTMPMSHFICHNCLRSPTASYLLNCGHLPFCNECSASFIRERKMCPICKTCVTTRHRAFVEVMKTKENKKDDSNVITLNDSDDFINLDLDS